MAAIAATSSATPSLQTNLIRSRLEAARREASQAQATVQRLRVEVDTAQAESDQRNNKVRTLSRQANPSSQADPTYRPRLQTAPQVVPVKTQELLIGLYNATNSKRQVAGESLKNNPNAPPVLNSQGQVTGRIVDLSA